MQDARGQPEDASDRDGRRERDLVEREETDGLACEERGIRESELARAPAGGRSVQGVACWELGTDLIG